jgi:hypothetical protein
MTNIFTDFNKDAFTVEELDAFKKELTAYLKDRRTELKAEIKANKDAEREARDDYGRHYVNPGKTVTFDYKGGTATGIVTKVSEKTFTVTLMDGDKAVMGENGKPIKVWRYFHQVTQPSE